MSHEFAARRDHLAHDLETLVAFLAPFVEGHYENLDGSSRPSELVIWYDAQVVTAVLDDAELQDFITCINVGSGCKSADQVRQRILELLRSHNVHDLVRLYHGRFNRREPCPGSLSSAAA